MPASVFIATSLDGFIARRDGTIDWLPTPPPGGDDYGYTVFMASVDCLLMGRHTFESVRGFNPWPYGEKPVFVLSTNPLSGDLPAGARVEQVRGAPSAVMAQLAERGFSHPYVDGGVAIQRFMAERLISRLIVTRVPVLIGDGIPLFGALPCDVAWTHRRTVSFPDGLVQSEYVLDAATIAG
jgi:dihydrofolate reductase